ncbi:endolytic transglycosylase MltG [Methylocella silvestris]|uniref:Endolytic murein transglycosylase n=1 Tax=Methylocella silvestris TaxID=199596 RepID=A0A2J7TCM8_METSI|nr:endolytic transglycosylase MltG [Methylocella silvestris]PNG24520.1 aminodeoxychorismate lyase [Methylocella silvestris]
MRVAPQSPNEALQPEAAPPPPPRPPPSRRRPIMSAVSGFLSFLLIAAVAAMIGLVWSEQRVRAPGPLTADKVLYIVPGTDLPEIIGELDRGGIIDSPFLLNVALLVEGNRSKVKAGEYLFKQGASLREVMDTLVSGKQVLHAITIPEGLTSQQIVERLLESDVLTGDIKDLPKEGSLMPDTYKVTRGWSRADLVRKMQDDQKKIVDQIWARRTSNLPLHSPYEMVTLASIVEKETGKADERPRVASVFMNRLVKRMRLQSDPTIVYGLVGGKATLGRGITRSELERPTPYNTYTIDGLPPGPIANPGRAALEAVANPSRTQDLYFVADGTGGHVFAETLDQHGRNVQRWRQIEKDARDKAGASQDIDKSAPPVASPPGVPKSDQRGEMDGGASSIYGDLGPSTPTAQIGGAASQFESAFGVIGPALVADAPWASAALKPGSAGRADAKSRGSKFADQKVLAPVTVGPGLDELGIGVKGAQAAAELDGPINDADAEAPAWPATGLGSRQAALAPDAQTASVLGGVAQNTAGDAPQRDGKLVRPRIIDVSEGTPLDPLRDKTYDLNFAKTVPTAKQMALPN